MELAVHEALIDRQGRLWDLYEQSFAELRTRAVQRHVMHRGEFDDVLADERVTKYVVYDTERRRLAGLATITNELDAVPLISTDYFAYHFPRPFREGNLWYVSFVAIDPDYQGTGTMGMIIGEMCKLAEPYGGVICLDIAENHANVHRLPTAIERIGNTFVPGTTRRRLDSQVYWAYQFPTPA